MQGTPILLPCLTCISCVLCVCVCAGKMVEMEGANSLQTLKDFALTEQPPGMQKAIPAPLSPAQEFLKKFDSGSKAFFQIIGFSIWWLLGPVFGVLGLLFFGLVYLAFAVTGVEKHQASETANSMSTGVNESHKREEPRKEEEEKNEDTSTGGGGGGGDKKETPKVKRRKGRVAKVDWSRKKGGSCCYIVSSGPQERGVFHFHTNISKTYTQL